MDSSASDVDYQFEDVLSDVEEVEEVDEDMTEILAGLEERLVTLPMAFQNDEPGAPVDIDEPGAPEDIVEPEAPEDVVEPGAPEDIAEPGAPEDIAEPGALEDEEISVVM